jgi:hypothetical protein
LGRTNTTCPVPFFNSLGMAMGMEKVNPVFGLNMKKFKIKSCMSVKRLRCTVKYYASVLLTCTVFVTWAVQHLVVFYHFSKYVPFFGQ